ncbi:peptide ABC transporter substrate-binding protein [Salinispira pacifica]
MRLNRLPAIFAILLLAGGVAAAQIATQDKNGSGKATGPGLDEFVVSYLPTKLELNPIKAYSSTEAQLFTAIYEGLVTYNPVTLKPVPGVASYWEVSPDGKQYRFYLRDNARYWNGDPVTASDFRNSWLELLKPENHSAYSFLFDVIVGAENYRKGINKDPESVGIRVLSPKVLEVDLVEPATQFLDILCHHSFVPVNPNLLHYSDWSKLPSVIGNGPYYITKRTDSEIDLAKNDLYWDADNVKIPRIKIIFRDDVQAVADDFNKNKIQWVAGGISLDQITNRDAIVINPLFATSYFFFKADRAPWNNGNVRRALTLLLPLDQLRSDQYQFIPATTLVPPIPYYPEVKGITSSNKEEAMKLLADAGFPDGKGLPPITIHIPDGTDNNRVADLMAKAWHDALGVEVKTDTQPYQSYVDNLATADYTLATLTWIGDFADPLTFLQMWTSGSNLNDAKFDNPKFDSLVRQSLGKSGRERYQLLSDAEQILLDTAEVIPLSHSPAINVIDLNQIDGWYPNPLDIHPFKYLQFAAKKPLKGVAELSPGRVSQPRG